MIAMFADVTLLSSIHIQPRIRIEILQKSLIDDSSARRN